MATTTRSPRARFQSSSPRIWALFASVFAVITAAGGCGVDPSPLKIDTVDLLAIRVGERVVLPDGSNARRRELIDGIDSDVEWATAPEQLIAVNGAGTGAGSFTVVMKAVHDGSRVYFLLQWPDGTENNLGPRLVFRPDSALAPVGCDEQITACHWELSDEDEDRIVFQWDSAGQPQGRSDVWHWRAALTNPIQFPLGGQRRVGFCDDEWADSNGRFPDAGLSFFRDNYILIDPCSDPRLGHVPLKFALALDGDGQPSTAPNDNMRPCDYIYDPTARIVTVCTTTNPCREFESDDVKVWVEGDDTAATLLKRPLTEADRESRHDIEARGRHEFSSWTLEISRLLNTGHPDDVRFDATSSTAYKFELNVMDNSGTVFAISPQVQLRFGS